jgi:hypothetical protein
MTQARGSHRDSDDDEIPPLPGERVIPTVVDEVPVLEEEEPPELPADEVLEFDEGQEIDESSSGAR